MSDFPRAKWNGKFWLHGPDPSHRVFAYCSCRQDTKERYWGQQFCKKEGHFGPTDRNDQTGQSGSPSKVVSNIAVVPNRNVRNFGLNQCA